MLLADDEVEILELVGHLLERRGVDVVAVSRGDDALEGAREHRPDAAILDMMMPGLNGYEVVRRLREEERTRDLPVLLLTARLGGADRDFALRVGAGDYMTKPFRPAALHERLQALLPVVVQPVERAAQA